MGPGCQKGEQPDYLDLLIVGDLNKAKSYSAFLTAEQLSDYRRQAYFSFFLARAMYHPISMAKTIFNVIRGGGGDEVRGQLPYLHPTPACRPAKGRGV